MTTPPSTVALPATLCAPPRIAMGHPSRRAKASAARASEALAQRATRAGLRSIIPFQTRRAVSYSACAGPISVP